MRDNYAAVDTWAELERRLLKIDAFISADPDLREHTGRTVGALLVLAGGMLATSDQNEAFDVAVNHAIVLMKLGFDHQRRASQKGPPGEPTH
jgi:hypothetical protein